MFLKSDDAGEILTVFKSHHTVNQYLPLLIAAKLVTARPDPKDGNVERDSPFYSIIQFSSGSRREREFVIRRIAEIVYRLVRENPRRGESIRFHRYELIEFRHASGCVNSFSILPAEEANMRGTGSKGGPCLVILDGGTFYPGTRLRDFTSSFLSLHGITHILITAAPTLFVRGSVDAVEFIRDIEKLFPEIVFNDLDLPDLDDV